MAIALPTSQRRSPASSQRQGGGGEFSCSNATTIRYFFIFLVVACSITSFIWRDEGIVMANLPNVEEYYESFILPGIKTIMMSSSSSTNSSMTANNDSNTLPTSVAITTMNAQEEKIVIQKKDEKIKKETTIAYAISITKFTGGGALNGNTMYEYAAILHRSIQMATSRSAKYDYHMIAFVHPTAIGCKLDMEKLGYEVQIRDTPLNISQIANTDLATAQKVGCCGIAEYLKLYSYTLLDYPVVVHLDLDCIMLKPMDEIFDLMIDGPSSQPSFKNAMWIDNVNDMPPRIDFIFTRDYNMVDPPKRKPHEIGVQGGFLVIKPNMTDFERMVQIILEGGGFKRGVGWGAEHGLRYGGYYGAGTIQGLASYYYGVYAQNRSLELNRCKYNTMVDAPDNADIVAKDSRAKLQCRTLQQDKCEDCRLTPIEDVYTAHFTVCGKPTWCPMSKQELCMKLFQQWHLTRKVLEDQWSNQYGKEYKPIFATPQTKNVELTKFTSGHCNAHHPKYIDMTFPASFTDDTSTEVLI